MGLRSAFNPLGALPIISAPPTLTWTVDNINTAGAPSGASDLTSYLVLPVSWNIGGSNISANNVDVVSYESDINHEGFYVVTLQYTTSASSVSLNDSNFTVNS